MAAIKQGAVADALFPHFRFGAGAAEHVPGFYSIASGWDGEYGCPGPREEIDRTGIAAGFRVVKYLRHNDIQWLLTTNNTDTKLYRIETGVWTEKLNVAGSVGTDIVSFKGDIAVGFGTTLAYRFSTDNGTTWTASSSAGNAKFFTFAIVQMNELTEARVTYLVDPNEVYFRTDLDNSVTPSTSSTIGDNQTAQTAFSSLTEDDNGVILIGTRRAVYSIDADGIAVRLTPEYADPPADAGGQGDRDNFAAYTQIEGRTFYVVSGYQCIELFHGQINEFLAPMWSGPQIPRMHLPINAITKAGEQLLLALGTQLTTRKSVVNAPGGTATLANTIGTTSDLWKGRYAPNPQTGQLEMRWHGVLLATTDPLQYMWHDEDDNFLYLASGDSETVNNQQRRCRFLTVPPQFHLADATNVILNAGAATVECLGVRFGDAFDPVRLRVFRANTLGLTSAITLALLYRLVPGYETTAYSTLITLTNNFAGPRGIRFPAFATTRSADIQFVMTGSGSSYAIPGEMRIEAEEYQPLGVSRA